MSNKGKLGSIEALRFVFMIMICFWHCYGTNGFLNHGYIAVEWFFILSGMLLYHSYLNRNEGTLTYTLRKYARFAPEYLTVLVYCYLRHGILPVIAGNRPLDIDFLLKAIPEALMLQDSGFYTGGVNYPLWYLCVLLWGGAIVHSLLHTFKHIAISVIFPFIILLGYTYIFSISDTHTLQVWDVSGCVKLTMLRGICDMSLGVVLLYIINKKQDIFVRQKRITDVVSVFALLLFLFFSVADKCYDNYVLLMTCAILSACFIKSSLLNKLFSWKGWIVLGALSWQMLIYHGRVIIPMYETIMQKVHISQQAGYVVFLVLLLSVSFILKKIYELINGNLLILKK